MVKYYGEPRTCTFITSFLVKLFVFPGINCLYCYLLGFIFFWLSNLARISYFLCHLCNITLLPIFLMDRYDRYCQVTFFLLETCCVFICFSPSFMLEAFFLYVETPGCQCVLKSKGLWY